MNLSEQRDAIQSRADLAAFVRALARDCHVNPEAWENNTLPLFLEAAAACIEDMDGYYANQGKPPPQQPS